MRSDLSFLSCDSFLALRQRQLPGSGDKDGNKKGDEKERG
jgi:hypothetical protein